MMIELLEHFDHRATCGMVLTVVVANGEERPCVIIYAIVQIIHLPPLEMLE